MTPIGITHAKSEKPGADGLLAEHALLPDRRSKKVGTLPIKARLVLQAARHCLGTLDVSGSASIGVSLGTVYGSMDVAELCLDTVRESGFAGVTPSWYATGLPNATAAIVAAVYGLQGPNLSVLGHQAGLEAIVLACRQIRVGRVSAMLAGGFDTPSARAASRLRSETCPSPIHPGVGLVMLSGVASPGDPCIIGWFQAALDRDALVSAALHAAGLKGEWPTVHAVSPSQPGVVNYLAATAPIWLIEHILEPRHAGLHALVASGYGGRATCVLVQMPREGA